MEPKSVLNLKTVVTIYARPDIEKAKKYLFDRYKGNNEARYGIVCSSRDKDLNAHLGGIKKVMKTTINAPMR